MFNSKESVIAHILHITERYKYRQLPKDVSVSSHLAYLETIPDFINVSGADDPLYSVSGTLLSLGYSCVVIGDYGAYIELDKSQIVRQNLCVKKGQEYRYRDPNFADSVKYYHYTLKDDSDLKIYFQQKEVAYADYVKGKFYVSVFDVVSSAKLAGFLMAKLKSEYKLSRDTKALAGKRIGGKVYIAKKEAMEMSHIVGASIHLPSDFNYEVVRVDTEGCKYSFIDSPDWMTSHEPIVGLSHTVFLKDGGSLDKRVFRPFSEKSPQVYHHKWMFSGGFSIGEIESMQRSLEWLSVEREKGLSSKIGRLAFWDNWLQLNHIAPRDLV